MSFLQKRSQFIETAEKINLIKLNRKIDDLIGCYRKRHSSS